MKNNYKCIEEDIFQSQFSISIESKVSVYCSRKQRAQRLHD